MTEGGATTTIKNERTSVHYCPHPYFGFVCIPNTRLDYFDKVPPEIGGQAVVTIDHEGFRNPPRPKVKPADETWVGLFGNSVAFSVFCSDESQTLGAVLETALNARSSSSSQRRVRVINFSIPGYLQPQILHVYLANRHNLDAFVCLDGYNELLGPGLWNKGLVPPTFPALPVYRSLFGESAAVEDANASFRSLFMPPEALTTEEAMNDAVAVWERSIHVMDVQRRAASQEALFVLQPVPERGKRLTDLEKTLLARGQGWVDVRERHRSIVEAASARVIASGVPFVDYADVFASESERTYTDYVHFSDLGCAVVGRQLADAIGEWPCFREDHERVGK